MYRKPTHRRFCDLEREHLDEEAECQAFNNPCSLFDFNS